MIKAVLFDMDGVLIEAKEWHYEALNEALELFGFSISRDAHLSTFDGLPTRKKLQMLTASRGLPDGLHDFINEIKQRNTSTIIHSKCKPTFNHQHAVSMLKSSGYSIGVCSNSVRQSVEHMMRLSNLEQYLDILGVSPNETLILEDNEHGISAAIASGGHLMKIGDPSDVTFRSVKQKIDEIEGKI